MLLVVYQDVRRLCVFLSVDLSINGDCFLNGSFSSIVFSNRRYNRLENNVSSESLENADKLLLPSLSSLMLHWGNLLTHTLSAVVIADLHSLFLTANVKVVQGDS